MKLFVGRFVIRGDKNQKLIRFITSTLWRISFLLLLVGLSFNALAQAERSLEELYLELNKSTEDSSAVHIELEISDLLLFSHPDSALSHAENALHLAHELEDDLHIAEAYNNIGIVASLKGKNLTGLENFQLALDYFEKANDREGASKILNNLGAIYSYIENYGESIRHHREGYNIDIEIQDYDGAAICLYNIALSYLSLEQYDSCLYYTQSLQRFQSLHGQVVSPSAILGDVYLAENEIDSAKYHMNEALKWSLEQQDEMGAVQGYIGLANVAMKEENYNNAIALLLTAEPSCIKNDFMNALLSIHELRAELFEAKKNYEQAYLSAQSYVALKDSLDRLNNVSRINELNAKYESEKREKKNAEISAQLIQQKASEANQRKVFLVIGISIMIVLLMLVWSVIKKRNTNRILNQQNCEIKNQRRKIISSINYARKIQNSILIPEQQIRRFLPESFVFFKPKDIVSGDFYWFTEIGDRFILATIDCTGHGVPGAFMSLIANAKLNKVVNEKRIYDPGLILSEVHHEIYKSLNQASEESDRSQDGMDMSLCVIDQGERTISFAGAQNGIVLVNKGVAHEIKADNYSIGGHFFMKRATFTTKTIPYHHGTYLYMFTDGFLDQFGGDENKKLNKQRFNEMLINLSETGLAQAKTTMSERFAAWRGDNDQIDDILVIGARL